MAGKKKVELFINVNNEKEFEHQLNLHKNKLICAEIYSGFVGSCQALDRIFTKLKFDVTSSQIVLLKVLCDEIDCLVRFREQSEPVYMFICDNKTTKVFRGVNSAVFMDIATKEWKFFQEMSRGLQRTVYELDQATPDETKWLQKRLHDKERVTTSLIKQRAERQAERKRYRAERMVPYLKTLNFVMFWPHTTHAHPELYERWNDNDIIMIGREDIELDEEKALDILYAGDAPINEASMLKLLSGPALVLCLRSLNADVDFVALIRHILYTDIPPIDETKPMRDQPPQKTAFEIYKIYSPTREQIWHQRKLDRKKRWEDYLEKRARRLSEMQRLARQAKSDAEEAQKKAKEEKKLDLLKVGNLKALDELNEQPDDEVDIEIPEELSDELEEESEEEEDENEYFPPPGLVIPGFYAPPNEIAKTNGLAILFPNFIQEYVTPLPEFLPPHVLVMLYLSRRHKAIEAMAKHQEAIIHMGVFKAATPYDAVHIAYTVKQYESMHITLHLDELRLAFMVSIKTDLALLELMDLSPVYVSSDATTGETECAAMFSVNYGDNYSVNEDFVLEGNDLEVTPENVE